MTQVGAAFVGTIRHAGDEFSNILLNHCPNFMIKIVICY